MESDKLVVMANQIAAFFRAYPATEAMTGVREHLEAFWTPGMRATLARRVQENPAGVEGLVVAALAGPQQEAESPITKEVRRAGAPGEMARDAG